jgi:hypothetical protein
VGGGVGGGVGGVVVVVGGGGGGERGSGCRWEVFVELEWWLECC